MPRFKTRVLVQLESDSIQRNWLAKRFKDLQGKKILGFTVNTLSEPVWEEMEGD